MAAWRQTTTADIPGLMLVADAVHPALPESDHVFTERVNLFPDGSLVLVNNDKEVCGYAISHPIRHRQPPALDSLLEKIAADADQYYIHDLAILPEFRGSGYARQGIENLLAVALRNGYSTTCLVSVYGTAEFWGRFGFNAEEVDEVLEEKLREYGDDAVYLERENGW
ncbi:acyl-CoA N-acyltransferase [Apodospora peruviana]|uniref:Acyl-CoA N-acyltransferase n=1 Tax=Apodospora peruviana TaxID=516989 RepID=A0AAE0M4S5_9PEZI|nr:acyl-CoA N-acyltransferase [Apodospora peruviana]